MNPDWYKWANALSADEAWKEQIRLCFQASSNVGWSSNDLLDISKRIEHLQTHLRDLDANDQQPAAFAGLISEEIQADEDDKGDDDE